MCCKKICVHKIEEEEEEESWAHREKPKKHETTF